MPGLFTEDTYEHAIIELFENMGYTYLYAPDLDRDYSSPFLDAALRDSIVRINRSLPVEAVNEAITKLRNLDAGSLLQKNSKRQILMRSDTKLPQPFASWSNSL